MLRVPYTPVLRVGVFGLFYAKGLKRCCGRGALHFLACSCSARSESTAGDAESGGETSLSKKYHTTQTDGIVDAP
jgi:hypothetical protein